ncbi:MAG: amino acid permease [Bacteroidia bacterium]
MANLWIKKSIASLQAEGGASELKRTLGPFAIIALGIGAIIGAGLFSITGFVAADYAGPAITVSFIIAAVACSFAGLCYAEFASMIPVAGSAYTYAYATMGEFIAWIIGWDLVLEYAMGAATVSVSWSGYLGKLLAYYNIHIPPSLSLSPFDSVTLLDGTVVHGMINLPAVFIVVLMSLLLMKGSKESSTVNGLIVILKISIVLVFIILGWGFINSDNYVPYIPPNTGTFGEYGFTGIVRASAIIFFAYIGFDAVSTAAQEAKNPKRDMPIGILVSLAICTVLYLLFAHVMTGVTNYTSFKGADGIAPVAIAIEHMGKAGADGVIVQAYPWLNKTIILSILIGYASVIIVMLMGQSRVFFSMSQDGLLPKVFSAVHPKFKTPYKSSFLFMIFVSLLGAFVPGHVVSEMTSIGTLLAFILVCIGVWVLRVKQPEIPRAFKTPLVPLIPILGVVSCLFMMVFLKHDTWLRLIIWMLIGLDVYLWYGLKRSKLAKSSSDGGTGSLKPLHLSALALSFLLIIITLFHHYSLESGEGDTVLVAVSMIIAVFHIVLYAVKMISIKK